MTSTFDITPNLFFSDILEEFEDDVYFYDCETLAIQFANRAARCRCGWDVDTVLQMNISQSSDNFDVDAFWDHVEPLLDNSAQSVRVEVDHDNGPVGIQTRLGAWYGGRRVFISVLQDLARQKRMEAERFEKFSELSHELRTPLTSIKGALRLLETGMLGDLPGDAHSVLGIATRNTDRLLSIVNDILKFQKLEADGSKPDKSRLDLVSVVHEAIALNKGFAWEHGISLSLLNGPETADVDADHEQILQVLGNLLSNAIKHSPANGTVRVLVSESEARWRVTVSDLGSGIPENLRDKVFDSFTRAKNTSGKTTAGTGLGLAIARKIVSQHKGSIGFECPEGQGTDFYFELPKAASIATMC